MAFLTGKANITGGFIYSNDFCPLYIGKHNELFVDDKYRVIDVFTKNLDIKGNISIQDNECNVKLNLVNNIITFYDSVNMDILSLNKINSNEIVLNSVFVANLNGIHSTMSSNNQFKLERLYNISDNTYLCDINSGSECSNALQVTGKLNIVGNLYINDVSLNTTIDTIVQQQINELLVDKTLLTLDPKDKTYSGLLFNKTIINEECNLYLSSGILWNDNKLHFVDNIEFNSVTQTINNINSLTYSNIKVNEIDSTKVNITNEIISDTGYIQNLYVNKIVYDSYHSFDLNTITESITNIDGTLYKISKFTNGSGNNMNFKLLNPVISNNITITHQLIADINYTGTAIIEGSIVFPNGNITNKLKLDNRGQSILLTFIDGYWYLTNSGISIVSV